MDESYLDLLMAQQGTTEAIPVAGGGGVWVVGDVIDGRLAPVTLEAIGAARTLADSLGVYVHAVLMGKDVAPLALTLYQAGADSVRLADDAALTRFAPDPCARVLIDLFEAEKPEVVILSATVAGGQLAARLAQALGGGLVERVVALSLDETTRTVQAAMPMYGGEYYQILACPEARPQFFTIAPGVFSPPFLDSYRTGEPESIGVETVAVRVRLLDSALAYQPPPLSLAHASVVVAVGRQVGDLDLAKRLAVALGGQLAGDRGAWDAGWIEAGQVVDVRGVEIAPKVYVALGVRGDTFHNAAVKAAEFVVAIHPDPDAPIFRVADVCLEADPVAVISPVLARLLGAVENCTPWA